jgi:hypothetical protein
MYQWPDPVKKQKMAISLSWSKTSWPGQNPKKVL